MRMVPYIEAARNLGISYRKIRGAISDMKRSEGKSLVKTHRGVWRCCKIDGQRPHAGGGLSQGGPGVSETGSSSATINR